MSKHVNYRYGEWQNHIWDFRENEYLEDPDADIHDLLATKAQGAADRQESYDHYLETEYWSRVQAKALVAANFKCQQCSSTSKLQVHHKKYCKRFTELDNMHLLEVLCKQCHDGEHS